MLLLPLVGVELCAIAAMLGRPWRLSVIMGMVLWGCCLAAITEILDAIGQLTSQGVALAWGLLAIVSAVVLVLRREKLPWPLPSGHGPTAHNPPTQGHTVRHILRVLVDVLPKPTTKFEWSSLVIIAVLLVFTGVVAIVSPPNTWDVMDYHMPRVMQWIQRRSLAYFPVHYCPQLFYPPWAEWTILHLHLLYGSDRLSNLVQWTSFGGCIFTTTYIAKSIGVDRRGQWLAALLVATLPQAVLAASGSKNDLVASFWLLGSAAFVLRFARKQRATDAVFAGLALGLSILTKGTGFYMAPAIFAGCLVARLRGVRWRTLRFLALVPLLALALNLRHFARNMELSGFPTGPTSTNGDERQMLFVRDPTPLTLAANALRHLSLDLAVPSWRVNMLTTSLLRKLISAMGVDPDDPRSTWHHYEMHTPDHNEYYAGAPVHFVLMFATFWWVVIRPRRRDWGQTAFVTGVVLCFGLFVCAFPWNRWSARLHTIPFTLICAAIPLALERAKAFVIASVIVVLTLLSFGDVAFNASRPLISTSNRKSVFVNKRWNQYFVDVPRLRKPLTTFIADIRRANCREVGFDASVRKGDILEYPILLGLGVAQGTTRVWSVAVTNISATTAGAFESRPPCAVICRECAKHPEKLAFYSPHFPFSKTINDSVLFLKCPTAGKVKAGAGCQ